ncbi:RES domain-containing protein [Bacillus licheniformis]|uniref:RES domain-containing protein n=1 Tax=Bacillus licheniformis TaxID=1402 RepID=UPI000FFE272F|nr:RES domain-containing protein [Bacillus licheniformis]MBK4208848.1 hypothetical protein [Bacillus licheniformis]MEC5225643.1 RES domain-containing protein [Bacillus licheniformis]QAT53671.1 hypothetical protein EQY74_12565 [Bacillus licheniformis]
MTIALYEKANHLKRQMLKYEKFDDSVKKLAYEIYCELEQKPDYSKSNNQKVKRAEDEEINLNFFSNRERVDFLIEWTLDLSPILNIINEHCVFPLEQTCDNDFDTFIRNVYNDYFSELRKLPVTSTFDSSIINQMEKFGQSIVNTIELYLDGSPSDAFGKFKEAMKILSETVDIEKVLLHENDAIRVPETFYRMRIGKNEFFTRKEMFHIPFEKRGIIQTNRYSIPGFPCLYLGSSSLVCWEELGRPDLNTVQTSALNLKDSKIKIMDLSISPKEVADRVKEFYELTYGGKTKFNFNDFFMTWVLIAACSVKVRHPKNVFKPEYIIPQFLLEWIRQSSDFRGICYLSTKYKSNSSNDYTIYKNYAFPVQTRKKKGHCQILREVFEISEPVPWQTFQIYRGRPETTSLGISFYIDESVQLIDDIDIPYKDTDFGRLEELLKRKSKTII